MKLKNYIEFINESSGSHQYGCVMVELKIDNWSDITDSILQQDVYEESGDSSYGIEDNPHLTLLYGLHSNVTDEQIKEVFNQFNGDVKIETEGVGIFENPKYDVVKFNVKVNESLQYLHDKLSELPNSNEYPEYKPHLTIAYVKKGTGKKYLNLPISPNIQGAQKICYSHPDGKKTYFTI